MAEQKINYDLDLVKNMLRNARVPDILLPIDFHDEDAINRKHVADSVTLNTILSSTRTTSERVGNLPVGSNVNNDKFSTVFDKILFGAGTVTYVPPTSTTSDNFNTFKKYAGLQTSITIALNVTQNDAGIITSYDISGPGIIGIVNQVSNQITISGLYLTAGNMKWTITANYNASTIKLDGLGVPQPVGALPAGSITRTFSLDVYPAFMYTTDASSSVTYASTSEILWAGLETKLDTAVPAYLRAVFPPNKSFSYTLAIPGDYDIVAVLNDSIDITSAFQRAYKQVRDWSNTGTTYAYSIYSLQSTVKLDKTSTIKFYITERFADSITDVVYDAVNNTTLLDNEGIADVSWGMFDISPTFVNGPIALKYDNATIGNEALYVASDIGLITRIEFSDLDNKVDTNQLSSLLLRASNGTALPPSIIEFLSNASIVNLRIWTKNAAPPITPLPIVPPPPGGGGGGGELG